MIDHVSVPASNLVEATKFYRAVMAPSGLSSSYRAMEQAVLGSHTPNSDSMRGLTCLAFDKTALARGAADAGAPGDRDAAQTSYFGAFIFDLDGNRIEAVTFPRNDAA